MNSRFKRSFKYSYRERTRKVVKKFRNIFSKISGHYKSSKIDYLVKEKKELIFNKKCKNNYL